MELAGLVDAKQIVRLTPPMLFIAEVLGTAEIDLPIIASAKSCRCRAIKTDATAILL